MRTLLLLGLSIWASAAFSIDYTPCEQGHCSQMRFQINEACIRIGLAGKLFPIIRPHGAVCQCPCSCVTGDTEILTSNLDSMLIKNLREGTTVHNPYSESFESITERMLRSQVKEADVSYLKLSHGKTLTTSPNHTFVSDQGKILSAKTLKVGDKLLDKDHNLVEVEASHPKKFSGKLYNVIIRARSAKVSDHVILTQGVQSGDWSLQTTRDQFAGEIDLRVNIVKTFNIK